MEIQMRLTPYHIAIILTAMAVGAVAGALIARSITVRNCERALAQQQPWPVIDINLPAQ